DAEREKERLLEEAQEESDRSAAAAVAAASTPEARLAALEALYGPEDAFRIAALQTQIDTNYKADLTRSRHVVRGGAPHIAMMIPILALRVFRPSGRTRGPATITIGVAPAGADEAPDRSASGPRGWVPAFAALEQFNPAFEVLTSRSAIGLGGVLAPVSSEQICIRLESNDRTREREVMPISSHNDIKDSLTSSRERGLRGRRGGRPAFATSRISRLDIKWIANEPEAQCWTNSLQKKRGHSYRIRIMADFVHRNASWPRGRVGPSVVGAHKLSDLITMREREVMPISSHNDASKEVIDRLTLGFHMELNRERRGAQIRVFPLGKWCGLNANSKVGACSTAEKGSEGWRSERRGIPAAPLKTTTLAAPPHRGPLRYDLATNSILEGSASSPYPRATGTVPQEAGKYSSGNLIMILLPPPYVADEVPNKSFKTAQPHKPEAQGIQVAEKKNPALSMTERSLLPTPITGSLNEVWRQVSTKHMSNQT
ncbi:hypothetical protein BDK51DRAFT_27655, partial [Blyttiomyces helicus]